MILLCGLFGTLTITGCQSQNARRYSQPVVSLVELLEPVTVPRGRARVTFQDGRSVYAADPYRLSCELEVETVAESDRPVAPGQFFVRRAGRGIFADEQARIPPYGPFADADCGDPLHWESWFFLVSEQPSDVRKLSCRQAFNACWGEGYYAGRELMGAALGTAFRLQ
ncbi:MAG: hypothetical protein ABFS23_09030 [Pseudomonadota bacterium]